MPLVDVPPVDDIPERKRKLFSTAHKRVICSAHPRGGVKQSRKTGRLPVPFVPVLPAAIEAANPSGVEGVPDVVSQRESTTDSRALCFRPGDLLCGDLHGVVGAVTHQERR